MELLGAGGKYTALTYIQSTGTQYIKADTVDANGLIVNMRFAWTLINKNTYHLLFGFQTGSVGANGQWFGGNYSGRAFYANDMIYASGTYATDTIYEVEYSSVLGNKYAKLDGTTLATSTTSGASYSTYSPFLFAYNINNAPNYAVKAKMYSCKIRSSSSTLLRDYIPCYLTANVTDYWSNPQNAGAIGLWDTVSDKFFPNNGTGVFVAGNPL